MTYSEALFFIGKCLTLGRYPEGTEEIRKTIRSGSVEWERIVWVSTSQFVFPALYLQMKRAGLAGDLPADLAEYMEEFTSMNRERNLKIIAQANEITAIMTRCRIEPLFLKGTSNLLEGLYEDIAERMMGDIDLLVAEKDIPMAVKALRDDGYFVAGDSEAEIYPGHLHFPPLVKEGTVAAVEIHRWAVRKPYHKVFSYKLINTEKKRLEIPEGACVLSDAQKIIHNMMVVQVNDKGLWRGYIYLRQIYDLFLLSGNCSPLQVATDFGRYFQRFNAYLAIASVLLGKPASLAYVPTWQAKLYLRRIRTDVTWPKFARAYNSVINLVLQFYNYLSQITRSVFSKHIRRRLLRKLRNPEWYGKHFRRLAGKRDGITL